jgi:4'-phosphopantetheinyl transferase
MLLGSREVHIWLVGLDAGPPELEYFRSLLASDEVSRAQSFRTEKLRHRFTTARGILRCLLARYLHREPAAIEFTYGGNGKPEISVPRTDVRFSLSHSADLVACALTRECAIGVDVEFERPIEDAAQVARRFFHPAEYRDLVSLPESARLSGFYAGWTRKEAVIKALGGGLSIPLDSFRVTLLPGEEPRLEFDNAPPGVPDWTLRKLAPPTGYAGAVAYRDAARSATQWPYAAAREFLQKNSFKAN